MPLLHPQTSPSNFYLNQISDSLLSTFPFSSSSLLPAIIILDLFPSVYYFRFHLTHSQVAILLCFTMSFLWSKGPFSNVNYHCHPPPTCVTIFVYLFSYFLSKNSLSAATSETKLNDVTSLKYCYKKRDSL